LHPLWEEETMPYRWFISAAVLVWAPVALAQEPTPDDTSNDQNDPDPESPTPDEAPTPDTSTFDPDTKPEPPTPELPNPAEDTRNYAGVGSSVAYAERGVGEFGGSATFALTNDVVSFSADPTLGYFLYDNLQASAILGFRHLTLDDNSSNRFSLMVEPSLHVPVNDGVFWVVGVGTGLALGDDVDDDPAVEAGFVVAPRGGIQLMVGRSGLVNFGARYSAILSGVSADVEPLEGVAVLAFANTFDVQAGYTVMF
jgi:hypothetical protein